MLREQSIKLDRLKALMQASGWDAVYLKRQDSFAWLTCGGRNYVGPGETGNCGLLVTKDKLYAITNNIEAPRMVNEEKLEEKGFKTLYDPWHDNGFEKRTIESLVPSRLVGYDTSNALEAIKLLRFDLTEEEIERYRKNGEDASLALEGAALRIEKGSTEFQACSLIVQAMQAKGFETLSVFAAGDDRITSYRHAVPAENVINKRAQLGGNFRRYGLVVCLTRYLYFYQPEASLVAQYRANQRIDCAMMHSSRPGRPFTEPLEIGRALYKKEGWEAEFDKHHQGGPIGYAGRDFRVDFNTPGVIAAHQAFCWNPSITGTKSEDTVICTDQGVIPVTRPILYPKVEIKVEDETFIRPDLLVRL